MGLDSITEGDELTLTWLIGLCATTLGISIGGGIAWFLKEFHKSIATIYAVCGGVVVGLISFEIAPEAIHVGNWVIVGLGFIAGVILFELLHKALHKKSYGNDENDLHLQTGLLLILGISIHNFPMGIVLETTHQSSVGMSILPALILHNIPEGIILFTPLFMVGISTYRFWLISIIAALPVAVGALCGGVIEMDNTLLVAFSISLTIGIILMITVKEILIEAIKHSSVLYSLLIALIGFILIGLYFYLI